MNLFFNPSESEFQKLINKFKSDAMVHEVVVDYDGEVLVDPQLEQPKLDLNKFKVHVRITPLSTKAVEKKPTLLSHLFNQLLNAWNSTNYQGNSFAWQF